MCKQRLFLYFKSVSAIRPYVTEQFDDDKST